MPLTLDDLRPNRGANTTRKRVGRGHGSGRGKTAGRGTKGQKARGQIRRGFEGGQLPIQQRMPYKRGFANRYKTPWETINIDRLNELEVEGPITPEVLVQHGLIRGVEFPVKVLGDGDLDKALTIQAHAYSKGARERIEAAGGSIETLERTDRWVTARPRSRRLSLDRELKDSRVGKVGGPSRGDALAARRNGE
jgi:large subunit ribosomal protein L15